MNNKCFRTTIRILLTLGIFAGNLSCATFNATQVTETPLSTRKIPTSTSTPYKISETPTPTPRNYLINPTCDAPCWEGIVPGKTTREEAMTILQQNELILSLTIEATYSNEKDAILWEWRNRSHGIGFMLFDKQGKVWEIVLPVFMTMSLETAFDNYGEPSSINALIRNHDETVYFYYPDEGFGLGVPIDSEGQIRPMSTVSMVFYFDPLEIEDILCHPWGCGLEGDNFFPWKGYGSIWDDYINK